MKAETLDEVKSQVRLACLGVATHVKEKQSTTGVEDVYTQHWIENLIKRAKVMQKAEPHRTALSIQAELVQWSEQNEGQIYSGYLTLRGVWGVHNLFSFLDS